MTRNPYRVPSRRPFRNHARSSIGVCCVSAALLLLTSCDNALPPITTPPQTAIQNAADHLFRTNPNFPKDPVSGWSAHLAQASALHLGASDLQTIQAVLAPELENRTNYQAPGSVELPHMNALRLLRTACHLVLVESIDSGQWATAEQAITVIERLQWRTATLPTMTEAAASLSGLTSLATILSEVPTTLSSGRTLDPEFASFASKALNRIQTKAEAHAAAAIPFTRDKYARDMTQHLSALSKDQPLPDELRKDPLKASNDLIVCYKAYEVAWADSTVDESGVKQLIAKHDSSAIAPFTAGLHSYWQTRDESRTAVHAALTRLAPPPAK